MPHTPSKAGKSARNFTTLAVDLPGRSYPVYLGSGVRHFFPEFFKRHGQGRGFWITDEHVANYWGKDLKKLSQDSPSEIIILPPGEEQKNLTTIERLSRVLAQKNVERGDTLIACGGGVIGDLVGFTAACYMRGIAYIQVPTTLLALVDASVGGKTGVDLPEGKNLVGAFHQPKMVIADIDFLRTLPPRELVNGLAEVIKTALIGDVELFAYLCVNQEHLFKKPEIILHLVEKCVNFKIKVVKQDEREAGARRVLNFGHTVGHALEALGEYQALKHGEAVFLGMWAAVELSHRSGLLKAQTTRDVQRVIRPYIRSLPSFDFQPEQIIEHISRDKKVRGGRWQFVLLQDLGQPVITDRIEKGLLVEVLKSLKSLLVAGEHL